VVINTLNERDHKPSRAVLEARGLAKAFGPVQVLRGVDLQVRAGQIHAVLGENGAGKSTLMGILAGVLQPDAGELRLDDQSVRWSTPRIAERSGIAMVHQELSLIPGLSVAENIVLGAEPVGLCGWLHRQEMEIRARRALSPFDFNGDPWARVETLRIGEQQLVEIGRTLDRKARVIILDEPTAALSEPEAERLFGIIRTLRQQGTAIIYISHDLEEVLNLADRITVLRNGRLAGSLKASEADRRTVVRMMLGQDTHEHDSSAIARSGEIRLAVRQLCARRAGTGQKVVKDLNVEISAGEILGLAGLVGAGQGDLLKVLFGAWPGRVNGEIELDGKRYPARSPADAVNRGVVFLPEDRKTEALLSELSIEANISLAVLPQISSHGWVDRRRAENGAVDLASRLNLRYRDLAQHTKELSGGNQQKVLLARCLAAQPRLMLLDQPTRGVDIGAREDIYRLLIELSRTGVAILIASPDLAELIRLCHRVLVLRNGALVGLLERRDISQARILELASGGEYWT